VDIQLQLSAIIFLFKGDIEIRCFWGFPNAVFWNFLEVAQFNIVSDLRYVAFAEIVDMRDY
jgi:hypothetical protein